MYVVQTFDLNSSRIELHGVFAGLDAAHQMFEHVKARRQPGEIVRLKAAAVLAMTQEIKAQTCQAEKPTE